MIYFNTEVIKTDITALKIYKHFLLAGIGNQLNVFDLKVNELIRKVTVFNGLRIHGIEINELGSHILLNAENELLILKVAFENVHVLNEEWIIDQKRIEANDWILTTKWLQYNNFVIVDMHNTVEFLNDETLTLDLKTCNTKCILYCASICYNTIRECVILGGTVFSEILIWRPYFSCDVYHRLEGHQGVLFSIQYLDNYILSTSDDRSVILWKVDGILNNKNSCVLLEKKMHGHLARVFRCKLLKNLLLTAGEDGKLCIWDYDGKLIKTFNVHHGGSVWALECNEEYNVIVTGGSDSSIARLPLINNLQSTKIKMFENEIPKRLCMLINEDIIVITENGLLLHYNKKEETMQMIAICNEFKSYALLEVSVCRKKFALAGFTGNIKIYSLKDGSIVEDCSYQIATKQRIFAIHWLTCNYLLSCGSNGVLYLWKVPASKLQGKFAKTSLLLLGKYVIPPCKERWSTAACFIPKLGLAVGDRKGHLHFYRTDDALPSHTLRKAHSHLGITNLYWNEKLNILTSLGRNYTLRTFQLNETCSNLIPVTTDMLPFSWLGMKLTHENSILGFCGNEMILWDYEKRIELYSTNCGGGHRSWDANASIFIYIRDKALNSLQITRPIELISSMHSTEMNAMFSLTIHNKIIFISGGEDTALRFSSCLIQNDGKFIQHKNIATIKSHLSSIRCLELLNYSNQIHSGNFVYELISAGGRGQIIYWQLTLTNTGEFVYCKELHSFYEPQDEEIRIMDMTTIKINNKKLLFVGCSDGTIKIFNLLNSLIKPYYIIRYKLRCILKICIITLDEINHHFLITMATDGLLCFWKINEFSDKTISPIYTYQVHLSGINSYDFRVINHNSFCFLTGGDDNKISFILFKYEEQCDSIQVMYHYKNVESHCAQITGVYLSNNYFLTASLDQKLLLFEYKINDNELNVSYKTSYCSVISDIKGLNVLRISEKMYIVLYGLGLELFSFVN